MRFAERLEDQVTETPIDDAVEQERDAAPAAAPPPSPAAAPPAEADEADAVEQATDVPLDEDEYR